VRIASYVARNQASSCLTLKSLKQSLTPTNAKVLVIFSIKMQSGYIRDSPQYLRMRETQYLQTLNAHDVTKVCAALFVNKQLEAQIFSCMFICILYMFRAAMCPSSGELIVSIRHLVYVTLYRWPFGVQVWMSLIQTCTPKGHLYRVHLSHSSLQNDLHFCRRTLTYIMQPIIWHPGCKVWAFPFAQLHNRTQFLCQLVLFFLLV
jgi:hypothetical protein